MASTLQLALCLGMLALCLAAPNTNVRWCVKSDPEMRKCKDLVNTCGNPQVTLTCVHKASNEDCFKAIADGFADAICLDSGDLYRASLHPYNLQPVAAENYGSDKDADTCYYGVALVKTSSNFKFSELEGKRSCHTAVDRAAGWYVPTGTLLSMGKMSWGGPEEQSVEKAVSGFFSASCAPGAKEPNLCKQCAGKGDKKCKKSESEPYFGYSGASLCLKDDKGDVAFVKQLIPAEYLNGYELLCLDDKRRPISDYANCYWGRIPAHAVVTVQDQAKIEAVTSFLQEAQNKAECKLFGSTHGKDLLFKDTATGFRILPPKMDTFLYLGAKTANSYKALHKELEEPCKDKIRWCTQSKEEKSKCDTWSIESNGAVECVEASLAMECITKVMKGEADAVTLDGGYLHTAGACGLIPVMGEIYDAEECNRRGSKTPGTYYAVAIAKASDKTITWNNLKGKKSCHTGKDRTAGWNVPAGHIRKQTKNCDMGTFFKQSCAPGSDVNSNLCSLCVGDPQKPLSNTKCQANSQERYYGYSGALRCLVEVGDMAFVKHTTVFENIKDSGAPDWAKGLSTDDFELLCMDGTRKPVSEYKECNLAQVPAHAVATTPERKDVVVNILKEQQAQFGRKNDKGKAQFHLFVSEGPKDQLFKDSTECLREINVDNMSDFLGSQYNAAIASLNECSKSELYAACTFHTCKI